MKRWLELNWFVCEGIKGKCSTRIKTKTLKLKRHSGKSLNASLFPLMRLMEIDPLLFVSFNLSATWLNVWGWKATKRLSRRCTTQWDVSEPHLPFATTGWWYSALIMGHRTSLTWDLSFCFSAHPGMNTLLKKYELPKADEVNAYKPKLERIHAEFTSSK